TIPIGFLTYDDRDGPTRGSEARSEGDRPPRPSLQPGLDHRAAPRRLPGRLASDGRHRRARSPPRRHLRPPLRPVPAPLCRRHQAPPLAPVGAGGPPSASVRGRRGRGVPRGIDRRLRRRSVRRRLGAGADRGRPGRSGGSDGHLRRLRGLPLPGPTPRRGVGGLMLAYRAVIVLVLVLGLALARRLYVQWRAGLHDERRAHPSIPRALLDGAPRTWVVFTTPYCASCGPVEDRLRQSDPDSRVVK